MQDMADKLDQLERDGYVLIEGALSPQRDGIGSSAGGPRRARWLGGRLERRGQYVVRFALGPRT